MSKSFGPHVVLDRVSVTVGPTHGSVAVNPTTGVVTYTQGGVDINLTDCVFGSISDTHDPVSGTSTRSRARLARRSRTTSPPMEPVAPLTRIMARP